MRLRTYVYVRTYVRTYVLCTYVRTYVLYHLRTYVLGCSADFATRMYVRTYVVRTVSLVAFLATAASAARVAELAGRREGLSKEQLQAAHDCLTNGSASTFSTPVMQGRRNLSQKVLLRSRFRCEAMQLKWRCTPSFFCTWADLKWCRTYAAKKVLARRGPHADPSWGIPRWSRL